MKRRPEQADEEYGHIAWATATYLDVDSISFREAGFELTNGVVSVPIKDIKIADALLVEEGPRDGAMEPAIAVLHLGYLGGWTSRTSTFHLYQQISEQSGKDEGHDTDHLN